MVPTEWLRRLRTPAAARWQPMLAGIALAAGCALAAVLARESTLLSMVLTLAALCAWLAGACAMLGFLRWLHADALRQAERDRDAVRRRDGGRGAPRK
ncbi:MAG: hypothetical protein IT529_12115 [Burkholderiales bacterium]|nr:hypothetical protein [Burkholderiales bacterium]